MSDPKKFVLSYDGEYDKELNELVENTPRKRRSERVRQLILLGLECERTGGKGTNFGGLIIEGDAGLQRPMLNFSPPK